MSDDGKITFNRDSKFDIQLSAALVAERRLADIFRNAIFERDTKIELKSENWQWAQTGNICIEFACDGKPSGIEVSEADIWVHELLRGGETLCHLMLPMQRMRMLVWHHFKAGHYSRGGGDGGRFDNVLIPLRDILR